MPNGLAASDPALRRFTLIGVVGLIGCVVARAPTMLGKYTIPHLGIELSLNAGYVLVLGPLVLFLGVIWAASGIGRRSRHARRGSQFDQVVAAICFMLPGLSAAFLAVQFFLLLAPKGECLTFDRSRYLTDIGLRAFQPEYCMGMSDEARHELPWLLQPPILQGWLQVLFPLTAFAVSVWAWWRWSHRAR